MKDGIHVIDIKAVDRVGSIAVAGPLEVKVDRTAPVIKSIAVLHQEGPCEKRG